MDKENLILEKVNESKFYPCHDEYKAFLKKLSVSELVLVTHDLRRSPEDKNYLLAALMEMKRRAKCQQ